MLKDTVAVTPLDAYRLKLRFERIVDVAKCVSFTGIFAPLQARPEFVALRVNEELGTICWPYGADLDPDVLYALVGNTPIPTFETAARSN